MIRDEFGTGKRMCPCLKAVVVGRENLCLSCQAIAEAGNATHVITTFTSPDGVGQSTLFRKPDGMCVAHQSSCVIVIGADKNRGASRIFCDPVHALRWMCDVLPALDLQGEPMNNTLGDRLVIKPDTPKPIIEFRDGGGGLLVPSGDLEIPHAPRMIGNRRGRSN